MLRATVHRAEPHRHTSAPEGRSPSAHAGELLSFRGVAAAPESPSDGPPTPDRRGREEPSTPKLNRQAFQGILGFLHARSPGATGRPRKPDHPPPVRAPPARTGRCDQGSTRSTAGVSSQLSGHSCSRTGHPRPARPRARPPAGQAPRRVDGARPATAAHACAPGTTTVRRGFRAGTPTRRGTTVFMRPTQRRCDRPRHLHRTRENLRRPIRFVDTKITSACHDTAS